MQKHLLFLLFILGTHVTFAQNPSSFIDTLHPACNGLCDGYAHVKITGGTPPYSLFWNTIPVQSTATATNICPGTYQVVILDANNHSSISTVTIINDIVQATVTHTNLFCRSYGVDTASVSANSALAPFTYSWDSAAPTTSRFAYNLPLGANTVTTTDAYGCMVTDTFFIRQPIDIKVINTTHNTLCYDSSSGTITTLTTGGTPPYTYEWDSDTSRHTGTLANAAPGIHILTVTDSTHCIITDTAFVGQATPITIDSLLADPPTCFGSFNGVINAIPTGGTPPYTYSWNTTPVQTTTLARYLYAGPHILTITDSNNCIVKDTITLGQPTALGDSTVHTNLTCYGQPTGSGIVFPYGGVPPYHVEWLNPTIGGDTATGLYAGVHPIRFIDSNNCLALDTVIIYQPAQIIIQISNTPDSGGCTGTAIALVTGGTGAYTYLWSNTATTPAISGLCAGKYYIQVTDSTNCIVTDSTTILHRNRTGIAGISQPTINVYPDPFSEYIVADWSNTALRPAHIHITNMAGITMLALPVDCKTTIQKINTANWMPGTYFIHITYVNSNETLRRMVVKE